MIPRNQFRQAVYPGGPVRQPYSYSVPSPYRLFKNSSTGMDSMEWILPAYVDSRAGTTSRVVVSARQAGNRFLGSIKGSQIRAQNSAKMEDQ